MALTKNQIKSAALRLTPAEREVLAEELLLSIADKDRDEIDAAWLAEARSRDKAYRAGKSKAKPVDEVIRRLKNKVRP